MTSKRRELLWEFGGMTVNAIPSGVAADGVAYFVSGYQGSLGAAISLDSRGDLDAQDKVLWRVKKGTPYVPSPLLVGGRLYFTQANNSLLTILDIKTGKALVDREHLPRIDDFLSFTRGRRRARLPRRSGRHHAGHPPGRSA